MKPILLSLLLLNPVENTREDCVSIVHVNHYFCGNGRLIFDQVIFLDVDHCAGVERVVSWRLVKCPHYLPEYNHALGKWECRWVDNDVIRRVLADSVRESWTQEGFEGDPEMNARNEYPKERRRELRSVKP